MTVWRRLGGGGRTRAATEGKKRAEGARARARGAAAGRANEAPRSIACLQRLSDGHLASDLAFVYFLSVVMDPQYSQLQVRRSKSRPNSP